MITGMLNPCSLQGSNTIMTVIRNVKGPLCSNQLNSFFHFISKCAFGCMVAVTCL